MRKRLAGFMAVSMAVFALTACGQSGGQTQGKQADTKAEAKTEAKQGAGQAEKQQGADKAAAEGNSFGGTSGDSTSGAGSPAGVEWPSTMQRLSMGTGGTTGAFYIIGGGLANVINQHSTNIDITAEVTGATMENLALVNSGECQLGISNADYALFAYEGTEPYKEPQNVLGICSLYPTTTHIVASKNSGIKNIADMRGKRISVGPFGSGNRMGSERLLGMEGMTFDDIKPYDLTNQEAIDSLKDGTIDAFILYSGAPLSAIIDLTTTTDVNFISLSDEFCNEFIEKYPYFQKLTIPADMYGMKEDVQCVGVMNCLVVNPDVDEDVVYLITKAIFENLDELHKVHVQAEEITLENATNIPLPMHSGAEKYFKEVEILK